MCARFYTDKTTTLNVGGVDFALFLDDLMLSAVDVFIQRGQTDALCCFKETLRMFWKDEGLMKSCDRANERGGGGLKGHSNLVYYVL